MKRKAPTSNKAVDPKLTADSFNEYFVGMGQNLANQIPEARTHYLAFLPNYYGNEIQFDCVAAQFSDDDTKENCKLINSLQMLMHLNCKQIAKMVKTKSKRTTILFSKIPKIIILI